MVTETETKIYSVGSRHTIYLKKELVNDSAFPFKANQPLLIKIEGERLVIERLNNKKKQKRSDTL
jgi:hypothetical protein